MKRTSHRSWVEVSRGQLARNFEAVRTLVGPDVEVMPVVKAHGYGHGMLEVAQVLASCGARWFAVSSVSQGVALRDAGIAARIVIMADLLPDDLAVLRDYRLTPVLHDLEQIRELDQLGSEIAFHLKVDSGMGRLGTRAAAVEIATEVLAAKHARMEGLMTHFASAGDYVSTQTDEQLTHFSELAADLRLLGIDPPYLHTGSTIAIAYGRRESWKNMVRPGHAIYGYVSPPRGAAAPPRLLHVAPALTWKASLLAVKEVPAGARIGYGAMFTAPAPMRIGVIAAGYADGIPHRLSNKGRVIAAGRFARILGAVSMDLTTIDLTEAPHLTPGDAVTLIGREGEVSQDAQQLARDAGTISYSVLCGISSRVYRQYVD